MPVSEGGFGVARPRWDTPFPKSPRNQFPSPHSWLTQQIAIISANNKAWKALEREKNKTIQVTSVIADCIASNRQLKEAKDADKSVRECLDLTCGVRISAHAFA